jgi:hypothetical protein
MSIKKATNYTVSIDHNSESFQKSMHIYNHLFDIYGEVNFTNIPYKITTKNRDDIGAWKPLNLIYELNFVDKLFIKYYELCDTLLIITFNNITIHIAYEKVLFTDTQINTYIFHIINIIRMFDNTLQTNKEFNFVLSPFTKTLSYESLKNHISKYPFIQSYLNNTDINQVGIGAFHINTGVSINHKIIYLYRTDELFKVLFHECIHNFKIDIDDHDMTCARGNHSQFNFCKHIFVGENEYPVLINEAFTEYLALLLSIIGICILYSKSTQLKPIVTSLRIKTHSL